MRKTLSAMILTATVLAGCDMISDVDVSNDVGVIDHYGSGTASVIVAPATATENEDFTVTVNTFGGGCTTAAGIGVRYRGDVAILTPYDNDESRMTGGACTDILRVVAHVATLRFPKVRDVNIRVEGRREPGSSATSVVRTVRILRRP